MRFCWIVLVALCCVALGPRAALADDRIAIIDTAWDTRPFLDRLEARGVTVIGRYYARCDQVEIGLTQKRLLDQGLPDDPNSEIAQILSRGMAILSIYQFYNNSPAKFEGRDRQGAVLPDADCAPTTTPRDATAEARLDAEAAVAQARLAGQPRGTAIYFGVDFAFAPTDTATQARMIAYFQQVHEILDAAGYRLGAYGSGLAQRILRDARTADGAAPLIELSWLSASRAFPDTSAVHRSGAWDLFQNQVNREWFGHDPARTDCTPGLPIDTNVQNPASARDVGFWGAAGAHAVPRARTEAIWATRRFVCDGDAILRRAATSPVSDSASVPVCLAGRSTRHAPRAGYANAVRLGARQDDLVEVDIDDDGRFDAWTWTGNLTRSFAAKPDWIFSRRARRAATCD